MSAVSKVEVMTTTQEVKKAQIGESLGKRALKKLLKRKFVVLCFITVFIYTLIAILGYLDLLPDFQQRVGGKYEAPSWDVAKILGTDIFGRSVLYKLLAGTKTAMTIGFVVTLISVPIGMVLGCLSGFYGKTVDAAINWVYSVISSVPYILLIIGISYVLGKGMSSVCIALGAVSWVSLCRMIRGEVLKHKSREYVLAMRLIGASNATIMFKHILPNVMHLAIITSSLTIMGAIKSEVVLTFLGVGIQDGSSWGTMVSDVSGELVNGIWWPCISVTAIMFVIVYALNVVGDALRDALDPKIVD